MRFWPLLSAEHDRQTRLLQQIEARQREFAEAVARAVTGKAP